MKEQNTSTPVFELTATLIFWPLFASAVQMEALECSTMEVRFDLDFERQSLRDREKAGKHPKQVTWQVYTVGVRKTKVHVQGRKQSPLG